MTLRVVPVDIKEANDFVGRLHRHSRPVVGAKFAVGVADDTGLRGVAIVGRPVARALDDGRGLEILRVCTDGTRNACSMLYGAARRAGRAMGHAPIYTYTLPQEGGASLRAAGFRLDAERAGKPSRLWHNRPGRTAQPVGDDLIGGKWRWTDQPSRNPTGARASAPQRDVEDDHGNEEGTARQGHQPDEAEQGAA